MTIPEAIAQVLGCDDVQQNDSLADLGFIVERTSRQFRYFVRVHKEGEYIGVMKNGHVFVLTDGDVMNPPEPTDQLSYFAML